MSEIGHNSETHHHIANQTCHFPRILLNFYEMMVIEEAMACAAAGKRAFAVWAQVSRRTTDWGYETSSRK